MCLGCLKNNKVLGDLVGLIGKQKLMKSYLISSRFIVITFFCHTLERRKKHKLTFVVVQVQERSSPIFVNNLQRGLRTRHNQ